MTKFKNIMLFVILINALSISSLDKSEIWGKLYSRSENIEIKNIVALNIVKVNDRSLDHVLFTALQEDIIANLDNKRSTNEENSYISLAKTIIHQLGIIKYKESARYIYEVFTNHKDQHLKAECLIALGNMRAYEYTEDIAFVLETNNRRPIKGAYSSKDLDSESTIAYAAIYALDRLKDETAYKAIFFSSVSWYSDIVTNYAKKVLNNITDEPVKQLISILETGDFISKEHAINQIYVCNDTSKNKIVGARTALMQGHINKKINIKEGSTLRSIRKKSLLTYIKYGSYDDDIDYITQSILNGEDLEEKIYGIQALGFNNSDRSTITLSSILMAFNKKNSQSFGLTLDEQDVVRTLIDTIGQKKDMNGYEALLESKFSNYTPGIIRQADKALKNLES